MLLEETGRRGSTTRGVLRVAAFSLGLLVAVSAQAATYTVRVVAITGGDTLKAVHEGREIAMRLRWIDAPEKGQPFSDRATRALSDLVAGQVVTVRDYGQDRSGRRLVEVSLVDGRSLNRELVRLGWAWWARRDSKDVTLGTLEADARAAGRGLWADAHPIPPWEWRASPRPPAHRGGSNPG
jgi:micrococcal nuclease